MWLSKGTWDLFDTLEIAIEKGRYFLSNGCEELIRLHKLSECYIPGDFRIDIDTSSALQVAREG